MTMKDNISQASLQFQLLAYKPFEKMFFLPEMSPDSNVFGLFNISKEDVLKFFELFG